MSAIWLKTEDKYKIYKSNPVLNAVINKKATLCSQAKFCVIDSKGNEVKNDPLLKLLENPNILQNKRTFITQWVILNSLDGGVFNYPIAPVGFEGDIKRTKALINISMRNAQLTLPYNRSEIENYDGFVEEIGKSEVEITHNGRTYQIPYKELISFYDLSDIPTENDLVNPISRVDSIMKDLSNVDVTLEAMNVIANKPGGVGIVGVGSTDPTQNVPLRNEERKNLQDELRGSYGLSHSKSSVIFSTASIQYTSTMVRFADLGLIEVNDNATYNILGAFGIPPEIFTKESGKYENKKIAELSYIQDEIQSTMDSFCNSLNNYFKYEDKKLIAKFDHLPAFSLKRKQMTESLDKITTTMNNALASGLIKDEAKAKEIINNLTGVSYD